MREQINKRLSDIDLEIDKIDLYGYDIIEISLSMVYRLQDILTDLRNQLQTYMFPSKEEEIHFFKNQKPELLGRLLYFYKIYHIEAQCPTGSNEVIKLYINKELDNLNYFFNRNLDFYQYYRSHSTIYDEYYFLRGKIDIRLCTDSAQFNNDPKFSTGYDYKVAKIIANEMLRIYLNKKSQKLENENCIKIHQIKTTICFTGKKAALIEIGYALASSGDINHGNVEIKELMNYLSVMFNINLGGYYDAYIAMKERKDRTSYLNKLIEGLIKRMNEDDVG